MAVAMGDHSLVQVPGAAAGRGQALAQNPPARGQRPGSQLGRRIGACISFERVGLVLRHATWRTSWLMNSDPTEQSLMYVSAGLITFQVNTGPPVLSQPPCPLDGQTPLADRGRRRCVRRWVHLAGMDVGTDRAVW